MIARTKTMYLYNEKDTLFFKATIRAYGISEDSLAKELGINSTQLSQIINGKRWFSSELMIKLNKKLRSLQESLENDCKKRKVPPSIRSRRCPGSNTQRGRK